MARLKCSFTGGEQNKVWSNLKDYVFPFLKQKAQKLALMSIKEVYNVPSTIIPENGEFCDAEYSHILGTKHVRHNGCVMEPGDAIKVLHLFIELDNRAYVHTDENEIIPTSKLEKPEHLKKTNGSSGAFGVEKQIAKNLGGEAAGASKLRPDFSCSLGIIKGESKLTVSKMGQGVLKHDGHWEISSGSQEVSLKFKQIEVDNESLTCYLNRTYPDGVIPKGFSIKPASGTAAAYLQSTGANVLHVHDKKRLAGTSFVLDSNKNIDAFVSSSMAVLRITEQDIGFLDGSICIEKTQNGDTTAIHRPRSKEMKKLAARGPIDLHNPEHAKKIMRELK